MGLGQIKMMLKPFLISPIPSRASLIIKYHIRKNEHVSDTRLLHVPYSKVNICFLDFCWRNWNVFYSKSTVKIALYETDTKIPDLYLLFWSGYFLEVWIGYIFHSKKDFFRMDCRGWNYIAIKLWQKIEIVYEYQPL